MRNFNRSVPVFPRRKTRNVCAAAETGKKRAVKPCSPAGETLRHELSSMGLPPERMDQQNADAGRPE